MKTMALQSAAVYGPVASRRFGRSLGINLLPDSFKLCSFDCVYCQYKDVPGNAKFRSFEELYAQLSSDLEAVRNSGAAIDWLMLSGNGEPTLHPEFPDIVDGLLTLRDLFFRDASLGVLSNSSTCHKSEIKEALLKLDGRFMKLDAGSLSLFHRINRPVSDRLWGDVVQGLCGLGSVTIQSMFVKGLVDNTGEADLEDWIDAVGCIRPNEVQIYTVDRTPKDEGVLPVGADELNRISNKLFDITGVRSYVY